MQVKLLRALQEQEFERVGGIKTLSVDVRLIAATNRDLEQEIAAGRFREDLYYRLNVVHVHLPPLRERTSDIPLLLEHFVEKFAAKLKRPVRGFTPEAHALLLKHAWRGNIRELENVVERCMLFCDGELVDVTHLPAELRKHAPAVGAPTPDGLVAPLSPIGPLSLAQLAPGAEGAGLKEAVREATAKLERELIVRALEQTEWNVTHAAKVLKISRKSLQTKMKELGLREV
jgi:DNA-binding NtrC family response regulator